MEKFGYSVPGPRKKNEDSYTIINTNDIDFCCIADGVGGSSCGEFASKFTIDRFVRHISDLSNPNLKELLLQVNRQLIDESELWPECKNMATTFTGLYVAKTYSQFIHVGDTRLYLLRGNGLIQLTKDHTELQRLLDEQLITKEQAANYPRRNVLESAIGMREDLKIDYQSIVHESGDRFMIASDGFYGVTSKKLLRDLSVANKDFDSFCQVLVSYVNKSNLVDNCTFVVVQV